MRRRPVNAQSKAAAAAAAAEHQLDSCTAATAVIAGTTSASPRSAGEQRARLSRNMETPEGYSKLDALGFFNAHIFNNLSNALHAPNQPFLFLFFSIFSMI